MENTQVTRNMEQLEARYFELNRDLRATRAQLHASAADSALQATLEARLARREREMRAILQEIARVEDSLLE